MLDAWVLSWSASSRVRCRRSSGARPPCPPALERSVELRRRFFFSMMARIDFLSDFWTGHATSSSFRNRCFERLRVEAVDPWEAEDAAREPVDAVRHLAEGGFEAVRSDVDGDGLRGTGVEVDLSRPLEHEIEVEHLQESSGNAPERVGTRVDLGGRHGRSR